MAASLPLFALLVSISSVSCLYSVPALFSFGDSLLDAGNNKFIANSSTRVDFPPYGETFFRRPTGRFTNGRTIADFLAMRLRLPLLMPSLDPSVKSYSKGVNFASGGSGLLDSTNAGIGVLPMTGQLAEFHRVVEKLELEFHGDKGAVRKLLSRSMFILATGSNDIGGSYIQNATLQQTVQPKQFVNQLIRQFSQTILTLHEHGARKIAVFELGILGCTPFTRFVVSQRNQTGCLTQANQLALLFNANLAQLVNEMRKKLPDARIVLGKTYELFVELTNNAAAYGFESTTSACCGTGPFNAAFSCARPVPRNFPYKSFTGKRPDKFLFWDGSHPTEAAYRLMFKKIWFGNLTAIEPMNLSQLASLPV